LKSHFSKAQQLSILLMGLLKGLKIFDVTLAVGRFGIIKASNRCLAAEAADFMAGVSK